MRKLLFIAACFYALNAAFISSAVASPPSGKTDSEKFIHISNVSLDLGKNNSMYYSYLTYKKGATPADIKALITETEAKNAVTAQNYESKQKQKESGKEKLKDKDEEESTKVDDTKFGYDAYKTLKYMGYVDTVNKIFQDENNTIVLEGKISKINFFYLTGKDGNINKAKVYMQWYIKNRYGEKLDSVKTTELSRDFDALDNGGSMYSAYADNSEKQQNHKIKMVSDAVDSSVVSLLRQSAFKKYSKSEPVPPFAGDLLHIAKPTSVVTDKGDASLASVIIKREDQGHGSGFAISQDGYIVTNYHVIATKDPSKTEKVKVLTTAGDELEATVVRFNKATDVALLKVEKKFEKAFLINSVKEFKNLQDVYTIGAPKSIELGQTVTAGMISNERNSNNTELIQLSMPINFGNSGGPLFDSKGLLHGIIVSKLVGESTEGIGFAIPAYKLAKYINISY